MIKGILLSLISSILFGYLYYFAVLLRPLAGESVLGYRIIAIIPFIFIALFVLKQIPIFLDYFKRIKQKPYLLIILLITASNLAIQMWLFLWAPNNGSAVEVSIGYLLMPIVMVAIGKLFYKEYLSPIKWLAIISAVIGVVSNIIATGAISWESVLVCTGYPLYFSLRKSFKMNNLASLCIEMLLLMPVAIYFILQTDIYAIQLQNPNIYWLIAILGIISGTAFILYIAASNILPINLLGLLGYVEPFAMLFIAFAIGETIDPSSYILMVCLAISVILLIVDGVVSMRKQAIKKPFNATS